MNAIILIPVFLAFMTSFLITPVLIKWFKSIGLIAIDQNKKNKPILSTSHGIGILTGMFVGILLSIFFISFTDVLFELDIVPILAVLISIITVTAIGFFDDLTTRQKVAKDKSGDKMRRKGLPQLWKALFVLPAAIPLMAINAGIGEMVLPFFGSMSFGVLYPLLLIPIGVICVTNAANMLGGLNGIEAGMGAVALIGLGIYGYSINSLESSLIAFIGAVSCLAVLYYAFYPSKILPGDSATYLIGGTIAATVIIGNMELFGMIIFLPWIIEAFIKLSKNFKATCTGKLVNGKYLKPKNDKIESLTHVIMSFGKFTEAQLVSIFIGIEIVLVTLAFFIVG